MQLTKDLYRRMSANDWSDDDDDEHSLFMAFRTGCC